MTNSKTGPREKCSIARVINSSAISYNSTLEPLYDVNGELVASFPGMLGIAKGLLRECCDLSL